MASFSIKLVGLEQVRAGYRDLDQKQLPFASALALTKTAQDVQAYIRDTLLPQRFTLRRAAWIKSTVKIKAATKASLEATVTEDFDALTKDETGDSKLPYGGGKVIAVPLSGARSSPGALIPKNLRPAAVMQNGGFIRNGIMYMVPRRARSGRVAWGKGRQGPQPLAKQGPIQPRAMYALVARAQMKPRFGMVKAATDRVGRVYEKNFHVAYMQAMATAKR